MSRIADIEYRIESLQLQRRCLEVDAAEIADKWDGKDPTVAARVDAMWQASDDLSDEICALKRELDDIESAISMRQHNADRGYGR